MPQGNYSAYSQQYGKGPVDVAGKVGAQVTKSLKDKQVRDDKLAAEKKADDLRLEKEAKDKTERNARLYDEKVAKIIDTQDAPPSAQEVSIIAGDEIYKIQKSGLEGIDLSRAVDKVIKDANSAIQGITSAADAKANAPQDAFYQDGAFGSSNDQMMNGDFAFTYKDGRGQFVGDGNEYSVGEYNGMRGKTVDIPQINPSDSLEALDGLRKSQEWNLNTTQGQAAYKNAAGEQARGLISSQNAPGAVRFMYNNAEQLGIAGTDKENLLDLGRQLADGQKYDDLSEEQKSLFDKFSGPTQELYSNSLTKNLAPVKPESGSGGTGSGGGTNTDTKTYVKDNTNIFNKVRNANFKVKGQRITLETFNTQGSNIAEDLSNVEDLDDIPETKKFANLGISNLQYEDREKGSKGHGKGTVTIDGEDFPFESFPQLKELITNTAIDKGLQKLNLSQDQYEVFQKYQNPTSYLNNDDFSTISNDLSITYNGRGVTFKSTPTGVTIGKGNNSKTLKLAGASPKTRQRMIENEIAKL